MYKEYLTLNEVYSIENGLDAANGVFTDLSKNDVPWKELEADEALNVAFHGSYAGERLVNNYIYKAAKANGGILSGEARTRIVNSLLILYGTKWKREYLTLSVDYKPLENYSMIETEQYTDNNKQTRDLQGTNEAEQKDSTFAYNSNEAVDTDKTAAQTNTTDTGTVTDNRNFDSSKSRSGNIGVTTSQQMLQAEREVWNWSYFREIVFPDICEFLTLKIY